MTIALLIGALLLILASAELFTNALEHLGDRLRISEGVTGSIFAAVGTALPEAIVPVVAVFSAAGTAAVREEVGVGAILGAPLMLSTLTLFLMAAFAGRDRGWRGAFHPEPTGLARDLQWFLMCFGLGAIAIFVPHAYAGTRVAIAVTLVLMYFIYIMLTLRASSGLVEEGHATEADGPLFLARVFRFAGLKENLPAIVLQLGLGLGGIVLGAEGFVHGVSQLSAWLGVSALVVALLIVPVATELPEKINSILWIRRRKDTLAFGNITGAMVFQGSLLPAIGISLTPWEPRLEVVMGLVVTLAASSYLLLMAKRGTLRPVHLALNGACYAAYILAVTV